MWPPSPAGTCFHYPCFSTSRTRSSVHSTVLGPREGDLPLTSVENYEISVPNYNNVHRKKYSIGSKYAFVFNTVKCRYCYWELITCSTQCLYESHTDFLCLISMGQYWWDMTSWIKHGSYDSSILTHQYNNFHRQHCCSSVLVPTLTSSFCCNSMIFFSRPFATDLIWSTERASICSQS